MTKHEPYFLSFLASLVSRQPFAIEQSDIAKASFTDLFTLLSGNVTAFRATLWTNLEKLMNAIFAEFQKLANLKLVMDQRNSAPESTYDDVEQEETKASFAREEEAKPAAVVNDFWNGAVLSIGKHFQVQTRSHSTY